MFLIAGCHHPHSSASGWPRTTGPIHIDGEGDEPDWNARAHRSGPFVDETGKTARPYSEARVLVDDQHVYLMLYAADQDIHADDCFLVGDAQIKLCADGKASDPSIQLKVDRDGTIDDPHDDEEWVVEAAIPRALVKAPLALSRCDTPKDGGRRCGHTTL